MQFTGSGFKLECKVKEVPIVLGDLIRIYGKKATLKGVCEDVTKKGERCVKR